VGREAPAGDRTVEEAAVGRTRGSHGPGHSARAHVVYEQASAMNRTCMDQCKTIRAPRGSVEDFIEASDGGQDLAGKVVAAQGGKPPWQGATLC
jgi:hypothetical protein